ncbi:hypothetical protein VB005_03058 [Metarhizium brunneum]
MDLPRSPMHVGYSNVWRGGVKVKKARLQWIPPDGKPPHEGVFLVGGGHR